MDNARRLAIHGLLLHVVSRQWLRALRGPWERQLTVPVCCTERPLARASHATMVAISWIKLLVSLALVELERSSESFAFAHGWLEMCTLDMVTVRFRGE